MDWTLVSIVLLFMLIIFGILLIYLVYNKRVRLRYVTSKNKPNIVKDFRAREVEIEGITYWKLLFKKGLMPVPPTDAMDINRSGKIVVEARYCAETDEYIFLKDDVEIQSFKPFTTNQRLSLINQIKKANSKRKSTLAEHLPTIVSIAGLIIMLTLCFVFWEDITKPSLNAMDKADSITLKQLQIMEVWREIILEKQMISNGELAESLEPPN